MTPGSVSENVAVEFKRGLFVHLAAVGPVTYGLVEDHDHRGGEIVVRLSARVAGENHRLGTWGKVSDADDVDRARVLIAEHHDSLLALADPRAQPVAPLTTRPNVQETPAALGLCG